MAETIIITLAAPVVKVALTKLTNLATEEFLAFTHVRDDIETLKNTLSNISELVEVLETSRTTSTDGIHGMNNWLRTLQIAGYDAGDLIDSWTAEYHQWKTKKQKVSLPFSASKFFFQRKEASDLKKITARITAILRDGEVYRNIMGNVVHRTADLSRETDPNSNSIVEGRGDDVENLVKLLIPNEETSAGGGIHFTTIVGMGGLGKTFLAQLVFNDPRVDGHFKRKFWVCVTQDYGEEKILKGILEHNKSVFDANISLAALRERVLELLVEKRFLLVLDDLWNDDYMELQPLEDFLKKGVNGSRVLITSRNMEVGKATGAETSYNLRQFNDTESWALLEKIAFEGSSTPEQLKEYAKQIVSKCNGLPLAVKQVGGLLRRNTDPRRWRQIARSEIWDLKQDKVLPVLRLSYNDLPSSDLKQCFAFCSLFPKSHVFDKHELVNLWTAEEFIQPHEGKKTEEIGDDYFNELSGRFFFEISAEDKSKCRMHDLLHDLAIAISKPFCCQVKDGGLNKTTEVTRHASLLSHEVELPLSDMIKTSKKLRTLLLPNKHFKVFGKADGEIFHSLKYMRTLDLSSSTLQELSASIENLKLLHYLDLSKTEIKRLPDSLCNLYQLETLKLSDCPWLFTLPPKLKSLVKLRHLELDEMFWYGVSTIPESIGCLTSLHNLHKFQVGCNIGYKLQELKNMEFLTGALHISNLENAVDAGEANLKEKESIGKLVYEWSSSDSNLQDEETKQVLEDLQPHANIEDIQICHYNSSDFPNWIKHGNYEFLGSIYFNNCTGIKILSLGELPNLRKLRLKHMAEMTEWKEERNLFLSRLNISGCPKLTTLPWTFLELRSMKIKNCEILETIPVGPVQFIKLVGNPALKHWSELVVLTPRIVDGELHMTPGITSHYLLEANIINCPELQTLPTELHPQKLEISGCKKLSTLPDAAHAPRLQVLALDACHETLVAMIPSSGTLYSLVISNIPNLTCLPKWPSLPGLQALYIRECTNLEYLLNNEDGNWLLEGFNSLKHLSIRNCPKLLALPAEGLPTSLQVLSIGPCASLSSFGTGEVFTKLTSLTDLYLEDCPALKSLPREGLSASVKHLSIQGCPSLIRSCGENCIDWPKIKNIPDLEIETPSTETSSAPSTSWFRRNHKGKDKKESSPKENKSKGKKASK